MLFLCIFFSQIFLPTSYISSDVNVRCFLESIKSLVSCYSLFLCVFCFSDGLYPLPPMIINSFCLILLLSPPNVFVNSQLYFSLLKRPMWFFIFPNSLLFLTCSQCVCSCFLKHFYHTCLAVFIKELWALHLGIAACWLSPARLSCHFPGALWGVTDGALGLILPLFDLASCDTPPSGGWGRRGGLTAREDGGPDSLLGIHGPRGFGGMGRGLRALAPH